MTIKIEYRENEFAALNGWCVYEDHDGYFIMIDTAFATEEEAKARAAEFIATGI